MKYVLRYRNAVCPWCRHEFTAFPNAEYTDYVYVDSVTKQYADTTICPMCGKRMILMPNKAEGIDPSTDRYVKCGIRGI